MYADCGERFLLEPRKPYFDRLHITLIRINADGSAVVKWDHSGEVSEVGLEKTAAGPDGAFRLLASNPRTQVAACSIFTPFDPAKSICYSDTFILDADKPHYDGLHITLVRVNPDGSAVVKWNDSEDVSKVVLEKTADGPGCFLRLLASNPHTQMAAFDAMWGQ